MPTPRPTLLTSDEVAAHEGLREFLRETVLGVPQGPAVLVKVFPEVRQRHRQGVLVGVFALKLIQDKGTESRKETPGSHTTGCQLGAPGASTSELRVQRK